MALPCDISGLEGSITDSFWPPSSTTSLLEHQTTITDPDEWLLLSLGATSSDGGTGFIDPGVITIPSPNLEVQQAGYGYGDGRMDDQGPGNSWFAAQEQQVQEGVESPTTASKSIVTDNVSWVSVCHSSSGHTTDHAEQHIKHVYGSGPKDSFCPETTRWEAMRSMRSESFIGIKSQQTCQRQARESPL